MHGRAGLVMCGSHEPCLATFAASGDFAVRAIGVTDMIVSQIENGLLRSKA
jgi:hypothetical protein